MSTIYLIRHGQASFGAKNYDRLSDMGVRQARILGEHLAGLGIFFDAVYFGEMDRQQKTAAQVLSAQAEKGLPVPDPILDKAFNEYDSEAVWDAQIRQLKKQEPDILAAIEKDPKDNRAFQKVFSRVVNRWVSGKHDSPGDVTWADFKHRVTQGLAGVMEHQGPSKRIGLFSSGGPICVALGMALELGDLKTIELSWQIINASVSVLQYGKGRTTLARFNDVSHLELTHDKTCLTYR